jgi:AraC-like DNA-binding protein
MGKLAVNEATLESSLGISKKFIELVSKAYEVELSRKGDIATLSFHLGAPELDHEHMLAEYILLQWHRMSSWLIAENIPFHRTYFNYASPLQVAEYTYLFPGEHKFDACFLGFSFEEKYLQRPVVQSAESLDSFIRSCPKELYLQPKTDYSLTNEVLGYLKWRIESGLPTIDQAASDLNMTKRTMIRKLKDEGASYQALKDKIRKDRAIKLLTKRSMLISDVAEKLGFSDSAVFARAFKAWTGQTPKAYKENCTTD